MSMDPKTMRTWQVNSHTCQACAVLEATVHSDHESGPKFGVKYAVTRTGGLSLGQPDSVGPA